MLLDAMLADEPEGRNLDLAPTLAPHIDDFAPAKIVECGICPIDEAASHHSPGVECGGSGGRLTISHRVSRIRSMIAAAIHRGRRRSNFGPRCRRSTSLAAQAIFGTLGVGRRVGDGHVPI
jgi:hypothetical protein